MSGFLQFNDPLPPEEEPQALVVRKDPTLAQIIIPMRFLTLLKLGPLRISIVGLGHAWYLEVQRNRVAILI